MMTFSEALYAKIEAYINETMSPEDRAAFEAMLHSSPELAEEVEIHREMQLHYDENAWAFSKKEQNHPHSEALETYFKSDASTLLSSKIRNAKDRYVQYTVRKRRRVFFYYAAALVAIIVLGRTIFTTPDTTEELYARYANWENLPSLTERGNTTDLSKGERYFKQQNYPEAIHVFNAYLGENRAKPNPQVWVYLGLSYLESDQYIKAINSFDVLLDSNTLDRDKAYWYKALVYLKQGDIEHTRKQLNFILADREHPFYKQAKALMDDLK